MKKFNEIKIGSEFTNIEVMSKENIERLYLSYFNDFLTVDRFAEYYSFTIDKANRILEIGRKLNHRR